MAMNDILASALSSILNSEKVSKKEVEVFPSSKIVKEVLKTMNENGYIGEVKEVVDSKGNSLTIQLIGKLNKCGAIKPRFAVTVDKFEKFEKRFLPAKDFGILVVTTNKGIMTHEEAKKKKLGGKLLAYCY